MPRTWFARLMNAVQDGDRELEHRALAELGRLGINVTIGFPWINPRRGRRDHS